MNKLISNIIEKNNGPYLDAGIDVIRVSGIDNKKFLQGQLTNDIVSLQDQMYKLASYCTHQGKVISNMQLILNGADIIEIKKFLTQYSSPFLKVDIINPIFEDIWIKCKIKFSNISGGKAINQLNADFFKFICPWIYGESEIKNTLKKTDIVQFIKSRPYVSFVTGLSIIHFKTLENGSVLAFDSASEEGKSEIIEVGSPWSILVPRNNNKVSIIDVQEYSLPQPLDYNELNVEGNFIINSESKTSEFDLEPQENEIEDDELENKSVIKIKF